MKKNKQEFTSCSLLIREFPSELAESCLSASSEKVLTRAVLHCLFDYFSLKKHYAKQRELEPFHWMQKGNFPQAQKGTHGSGGNKK